MPLALFVQVLIGLIFGPTILKQFGIELDLGTKPTTPPATGTVNQVVPSTTPGAQPEASPTAAQIVNEAVKRPANWFGLALFAGGMVFLVAQGRAAAHEAGGALADTYKEAKTTAIATHNGLKNADGTTGNISRRAKK